MSEEKTRIHTRISPDTKRKMETAMPNANCQSQNEFVERAICFYSDYIMTQLHHIPPKKYRISSSFL